MGITISITDFRNNISDYINRIIYKDEFFYLKRGKSIVAKVTVYNDNKVFERNKVENITEVLNDTEVDNIKKNMKKFRNNFNLLSKKY